MEHELHLVEDLPGTWVLALDRSRGPSGEQDDVDDDEVYMEEALWAVSDCEKYAQGELAPALCGAPLDSLTLDSLGTEVLAESRCSSH